MKKFFGILLAAVSALVLLPGCGGGDNSNPTRITAREFARGAKYFIFQNGLAGWLYVMPDKQFDGYQNELNPTYNDAGVLTSETVDAVVGTINCGGKGGPVGGFKYVCHYDDKGVPQTAVLTISTEDNSEANQALVNFFRRAQGEDGADLRGAPVLSIDFNSNMFTMQDDDDDDDAQGEPVTIGGTIVVQRR